MWIVLFVIRQESNIDSVCYGVALSLRDDSGMKENQDPRANENSKASSADFGRSGDKRSASGFKGNPFGTGCFYQMRSRG